MAPLKEIVDRVVARSGLDQVTAGRACEVVVAEIGAGLEDRDAIAAHLPAGLREALGRRDPTSGLGADMVYGRVGAALELPINRALEVTQVVCETLGVLIPDARVVLVERLPAELGELFAPRPSTEKPPAHDHRNTLASGRAGSAHPVSEAPPPGPQKHSVTEGNPHAASKISTARVHDDPSGTGAAS